MLYGQLILCAVCLIPGIYYDLDLEQNPRNWVNTIQVLILCVPEFTLCMILVVAINGMKKENNTSFSLNKNQIFL